MSCGMELTVKWPFLELKRIKCTMCESQLDARKRCHWSMGAIQARMEGRRGRGKWKMGPEMEGFADLERHNSQQNEFFGRFFCLPLTAVTATLTSLVPLLPKASPSSGTRRPNVKASVPGPVLNPHSPAPAVWKNWENVALGIRLQRLQLTAV